MTLVVAHLLRTVKRADLNIVFDHGRILGTGTYAALVAEGGIVRALPVFNLPMNGSNGSLRGVFFATKPCDK